MVLEPVRVPKVAISVHHHSVSVCWHLRSRNNHHSPINHLPESGGQKPFMWASRATTASATVPTRRHVRARPWLESLRSNFVLCVWFPTSQICDLFGLLSTFGLYNIFRYRFVPISFSGTSLLLFTTSFLWFIRCFVTCSFRSNFSSCYQIIWVCRIKRRQSFLM